MQLATDASPREAWKDELPLAHVEITSRCNMDCLFCPSHILRRERGDMSHETVLGVLGQLRGFSGEVQFHCLGEPLLNGRLEEYLAFCDGNGIYYCLTTNALLLSEEMCNRLFTHKNLRLLEVSLQTISVRSFGLRRSPVPFDRYIQRVKGAVFNRQRFRAGVPIRLDVMYDALDGLPWQGFDQGEWQEFCDLMEEWRRELEQRFPEAKERYRKFFAGKKRTFAYGGQYGDQWRCRKREDLPQGLFSGLPPEIRWLNWEMFPEVFVTLKKFFLFGGDREYLRRAFAGEGPVQVIPAQGFNCGWQNSLVVLSNGTITFCCLDYEGRLSCGNIADMSLNEAMASPMRKKLLDTPDAFEFCRNCKGRVVVQGQD